MTGKDIFLGLQHLDTAYIQEAEFGEFSRAAFERDARRPKLLLLAAILALVATLVGCGIVYVLNMQNLKLGERAATWERWDGETLVEKTKQYQVLTLSGLKGSANYAAAKEWYDFLQTYDPDYKIYHENKDAGKEWLPPEGYSLYNIYTPQMQETLDAITEKYGLGLKGSKVNAVSPKALLAYLGLDSIFLPEAQIRFEDIGTSYYDGGWFHTDIHLYLQETPDWPYRFLCSLYYNPKDCFDNSVCELTETADWQEWNYTTASGAEVLVIRSPSVWVSWVFCDRGDATISLRIETIREVYRDDGVEMIPMTDDHLKQVLDTIDFSIRPQPGDPQLLQGLPAQDTPGGYSVELKSAQTDGKSVFALLDITAPEGTSLKGLQFTALNLSPEEGIVSPGNYGYGDLPDSDGKDNTKEIRLNWELPTGSTESIAKGSTWNLYIENLESRQWNSELSQQETLWKQEGVWNLPITFDDTSEYGEIEFVSEPITTLASIGWDMEGNDVWEEVTIVSLKLRGFGGEVTYSETIAPDLSDPASQHFPQVVFKDGSSIPLRGDLKPENPEDEGKLIPLDQVECLLLIDGTKLYPQT